LLLFAATATSVAALSERAFTATFSWTRGDATSNGWSKPLNWESPDGGTSPPNDSTADVVFTGTPAVAGNTTQDGTFTVNSITYTSTFNPGTSHNISGSSTLFSHLVIGAGGVHSDQNTIITRFTVSTGGGDIQIAAPQTWYNNVNPVTAAGTLTNNRTLVGPAGNTITKDGPGLLILTADNSAFLGGFSINDGTIRLQNNSHAFGLGPLTMNSANRTTVTASTDLPQIIEGNITFGNTGTASFGGSFPFTWNGAVNFLNDKIVTNGGTQPITANGVISGARYLKQGSGTLTLNAANTNAGFEIRGGYVPVGIDNRLGASGGAVGLGGVLSGGTFTTGTLLLTADLNTSNRDIQLDQFGGNLDGAGFNATFGAVTGGVGTLNKYGSGVLNVTAVRAGSLNIAAGTVNVLTNGSDTGTSKLDTLILAGGVVAPTSTLDLNDNDLVIGPGTSMADVEALVKNARNTGAWDQQGITSSAARANALGNTNLGVISGADYTVFGGTGTFSGQAYVAGDTLVKYTWNGDANFTGTVNFDDYVRVDVGFNTNLTGWSNGDFNYSGSVNFDDYVLIDVAFNTQSGTLGRVVSYLSGDDRSSNGLDGPAVQKVLEHFDRFGLPYAAAFLAAVPEPATFTLLAVPALAGLICRRRRRNVW
jgi:autotransporter-associated beta strand protein